MSAKTIADAHLGIAHSFVRSRIRPGEEFDDLLSDAYISLRKAADAYNPSIHRCAFSTYAWGRMSSTMGHANKKSRQQLAKDSAFCFASTSSQNPERQIINHIFVGELLGMLHGRLRALLTAHYLRDKTLQETGEQLGLTEKYVRRLRLEALVTLRTKRLNR